jgi:myo-inositol 2-dehydrogenase / D-chiro-inositol 1-dehydrogenase
MIRLAFVGCGAVTEEEHLPAIRGFRDVQVVAVADPNPERLHHVADRFGIPERYKDVESLLDSTAIDAAAICVPAASHRSAILPVLAAGKHALIEKPPGLSLDDVEQMILQARRSSGKVMVGYHMRWHRLVRQARTTIESGILGPIESIRVVWYGPRDDLNLPLWRERRDLGGGALVETGVDHFDLWRFLLGAETNEIFALSRSGRRDDEAAVVSATLSNGILASAVFSERTTEDIEVEICGLAGRLRVSCARVEGLAFYPAGSNPASPRARLRRIPEVLAALPRGLANLRSGGDFKTSYRTQWRHFLDAIQNDTPVECTLEDGRAALQIALASLESAAHRQPVQVRHAARTVTPAAPVAHGIRVGRGNENISA